MSHFKSTLSTRAAYDSVVSILEQCFGEMPKKGIVAGQAVASAIYDILGISSTGPYNDLDVYVEPLDVPETYEVTDESTGVKTITHGIVSSGVRSSFDGIFQPMEKNGYCLYGSGVAADNPDINYITIMMACDSNASREKVILDGFDINACMCALDSKNKRLVVNDQFLDFLETCELKIVNYFTPIHTIVRAVKKAKELDFCTFDHEKAISEISTIRKYIESQEIERAKSFGENCFSGHVFSDVYKQRFDNQADVLADHFTLESKMVTYTDPNPFIHIQEVQQREMFVINPVQWDGALLNKIHAFKDCTKMGGAQSSWHNIEDDIFFIKEIMDLHEASDWRLDAFNDLLDLSGRSETKMKDGFKFLFSVLFSSKCELIRMMSDEQKLGVARLMHFNPALGRISKLALPPQAMVTMLDNILWLRKTNKNILIGELIDEIQPNFDLRDRNDEHYRQMTKFMTYLIAPDFKTTTESAWAYRLSAMENKTIVPRFNNAIRTYDGGNLTFTEIATEISLFNEANKHQCLENAVPISMGWRKIQDGKRFWFSVKDAENDTPGYTIEVSIDSNNQFTVESSYAMIESAFNRSISPADDAKIYGFINHLDRLLLEDHNRCYAVSSEGIVNYNDFDISRSNIDEQNIRLDLSLIDHDWHIPRTMNDYSDSLSL